MALDAEQRRPDAPETTAHRMNRLLAEAQERVLELVDDARPVRPPDRFRAARNVALALAAMVTVFGLVLRVQQWVAPEAAFDEASMQRFKVRLFEERKDDVDLVFIGTSRVYREFDPVRFGALSREAGRPLDAFNFGLRGMPLPEMRHWVEWVLERRPARLRYVVMELTGDLVRAFGRPFHRENAWTDRVVAWHDLEETSLVSGALLDSSESLRFRLDGLRTHWLHWARRATSTGVGLPLARVLLGLPEAAPERPWPRVGQITFEDEVAGDPVAEAEMRRWLDRFHADHSEYDALLAALRAAPRTGPLDPHVLSGIQDIAARVRNAGAVPVFVVMPPHWVDGLEAIAEHAEELGGLLLDYGDPDRFPEFYAYENLYNVRHLNGRGTVLFTERFTADFLAATAGAGPAR